MNCTSNNQTHFNNEQDYTAFCEVCKLHVKVFKFRSCEIRHEALQKQGIDVFKEAKELDKVIGYQMGQQISPTNTGTTPISAKKTITRRGR